MLLREVFSFVVGSYVPCKCTHKLLSVQKIKIQRTFQVALVIETVASVSITGKFETLGSNFSQEIRKAKLLASIATAPKVRCILILLKAENSLFMKFSLFTLLEVVDKCIIFLYLMYANRFHKWFLIEKKKG